MISGGQCVMTPGTVMMQLLSADSWDMHTLEVSEDCWIVSLILCVNHTSRCSQNLEFSIALMHMLMSYCCT